MGFYEELISLEETEAEAPANVLAPQPNTQGGFYEELLRLGEVPQSQTSLPSSQPSTHAIDPSGLGRPGLLGLPIPPSQHEEVAAEQFSSYSNPNTIVKEQAEKLIRKEPPLELGMKTGYKTEEGRDLIYNNRINPDGSQGMSSEYTIGVIDKRINNGEETHIPSIYNGYQVDEKTAADIIAANNGHDPETGRFITSGGNPEARSELLGKARLGAVDYTTLNLGIGLNQLKKGFGGLVDYLGADWAGDYLKKSAEERIQELEGLFTKADLEDVKKPLFVDDPEGLFRIKINPDGTKKAYWGKIVQQIPNLAASVGTGAGFAKTGFEIGKKVFGKKVSEKVLTKGSGALGFGAGEGAVELGFAKAEVEDAINQAPLEIIKTSPRFNEIYNDLISNEFSPGDAEREARKLLADELSQGAATKTGITTGLIGAPFGAWLSSVLKYTPEGSLLKRGSVGFAGEAGQEFAQTGVGGVIKEVAKSDAGLPMKSETELYKEAAEGAATGGPLGMGLGVAAGSGKSNAEKVGDALNDLVEGSDPPPVPPPSAPPAGTNIILDKVPQAIPQNPINLKPEEEIRQEEKDARQTRRDERADQAKETKAENIVQSSQSNKQKNKTAKGRAEAKEKKAGREGVEEDVLQVPETKNEEYRPNEVILKEFQEADTQIKEARETKKPLSEQTDLRIKREKLRKEGQENRVRNLESEGNIKKAGKVKEKIKKTEAEIERLEGINQSEQSIEDRTATKAERKVEKAKQKEFNRLDRETRPDVEEAPVQEAPAQASPEELVAEIKAGLVKSGKFQAKEETVEEPPKKSKAEGIQEEIDKVKKATQDKEEFLETVAGYTTIESLANTQSEKYSDSLSIPGTKNFNKRRKNLKLNNRADSKKFLVDLAKKHKVKYSGHKGSLSNEDIARNIATHIFNKYGIKLKSVGIKPKENQNKDNLKSQMGGKTGFSVDFDEVKSMFGGGFAENLLKSGVGLVAKRGGQRNVLSIDQFGEVLEQGGYAVVDGTTGKVDPREVEEVLDRLGNGDKIFSLGEDLTPEMTNEQIADDYVSRLEVDLGQSIEDQKASLPDKQYNALKTKVESGEATEAESEKLGKADDARAREKGDSPVMFFMGTGAVVDGLKNLMQNYKKGADKLYSRLDKFASEPHMIPDKVPFVGGKTIPGLAPLGNLPNQEDYLNIRDKLGGRLQGVDKIAKDVFKAFNAAPEEDKPALLEFLTNKDVSSTMIVDPEARRVAVRVKKTFETAGKIFVEKGLLSQEAFDNYSGAYLPRLYMAHLVKGGDLDNAGAIKLPNGKKTSSFGFLKERKEIPEEIRDTILGEIKNAGFLAASGLHTELRDIAILDMMEKIAPNPDWVLPKSVAMWPVKKDGTLAKNATPWSVFYLDSKATQLRAEASRIESDDPKKAERLKETAERMEQAIEEANTGKGEIDLTGLPTYVIDKLGTKASALDIKTKANELRKQAEFDEFKGSRADRMIELADRLDALADPVLKPRNPNDYKKVPDDRRYGALRGAEVHKEIYEDLLDTMETTHSVMKFLEATTQAWKLMKVAANPPSIARNIGSNLILLNLSGISMSKIPKYAYESFKQMNENGPAWKIAKRYGIGKSTFNSQEMNFIQEEFLRIEKSDNGPMAKVHLISEALVKVARTASDFYGAIEGWGKTMKIMDELDKGSSTKQAVQEANKWLFDYSLIPKTVRFARKFPVGMPFLTFYYKAFPRMIETAIKTPWRFAPYMALYMGMAALFKGDDIDDEDYDKLVKHALPDFLRGKPGVVPLPWKDDNGKWQFLDVSYFFPWAQFTQFYNLAFNDPDNNILHLGTWKKLAQTMGLFGGPLPAYLTGIQTNLDPFTGKEIVREGALPSQKTYQTLAWMYNVMAPPWLNYGPKGSPEQFKGVLQKFLNAAQGKNLNVYTGEPKRSLGQASARFFGLNIYPIDYKQSVRYNVYKMEKEIKAVEKNLNRMGRDPNYSKEQKKENAKEYIDYLKGLQVQIRQYIKDTKLSKSGQESLFSKQKGKR